MGKFIKVKGFFYKMITRDVEIVRKVNVTFKIVMTPKNSLIYKKFIKIILVISSKRKYGYRKRNFYPKKGSAKTKSIRKFVRFRKNLF